MAAGINIGRVPELGKMFSLDTLLGGVLFQPTLLHGPLRRFPDEADSADEVYWPMWHALSVPCLRIPPPGESNFSLLLLHGNADTLAGCRPLAHQLAAMLAADVYVLEYPGYWVSSAGAKAAPSAAGVYDVASRAARFLLQKTAAKPLYVMGYSMGCSPAARVLKDLDTSVARAVLVAPMRSLAEVAAALDARAAAMLWAIRMMDTFQTEKDALHISAHTLVVHGEMDNVIPPEHGRRCVEGLALGPLRLVGRH